MDESFKDKQIEYLTNLLDKRQFEEYIEWLKENE